MPLNIVRLETKASPIVPMLHSSENVLLDAIIYSTIRGGREEIGHRIEENGPVPGAN